MKTGVRELMSIWLLNYTVRGKYKSYLQMTVSIWKLYLISLPTWASDINIHAVTFKFSLGWSEGHGGRHTDICSCKVMLCPLSAVHCIFSVWKHTWLLNLKLQEKIKKRDRKHFKCKWLKTYTHRHTYTLLCFCLCKLQNTCKTDLEPFWFWAVCIYPLVTMISEERFFHSFWHVPVGRWITM